MADQVIRRITVSTVVLAAAGGLFAWQGRASAPAIIVLDAAGTVGSKPVGAIPPGWELKVNAGRPNISLADQDGPSLRFRSDKSSFALERAVDVDPAQTPYLDWRWKVTELPRGGDFRHYTTDDQAAQVMVAFSDHRIITYIWDSTAPAGTMVNASSVPLVHIFAIVLRSGGADIDRWLQEDRNVAADYQKAFGKPAPHVKGLRLQINSQHTGSSAESYFGQVVFRNTQS